MKRKHILLFISILLGLSVSAQNLEETVIKRYGYYLLHTLDHPPVSSILKKLDSIGKWRDIDYNGTLADNWQPSFHLKRVRSLALAWANPNDNNYQNKRILKAIQSALHFWVKKQFKSGNWWYNEIGIPQYMRDIIILMRPAMSHDQLKNCLKVMAQLHVGNGGANLIWSADLGLHYGALTGDTTLMQRCRQLIINEIKITTGEGIQPDFSFHQHGPRMQMYHYGGAFLTDNIKIAWELRGTSLAYPDKKIDILIHFLLDGWQWMTRGINTVPGTIDRAISRNDALHSSDVRPLLPFLSSLRPKQAAAFKAIAASQNGAQSHLEGFRYYPYSDFSAFQQRSFSFFLKTLSDRTLATESINQENKKGALLSSGDAYFLSNGNQYYNMMPVWDWDHLPGITSFKGAKKIKQRPFVGSVSDGINGLTVMDYQLKGDSGQLLKAHKFWACHDQEVICLIAGLGSKGIGQVFTTLDQSRLQGKITMNRPDHYIQKGNQLLKNVYWLHHGNFMYRPLKPATIDLTAGKVTGTWHSITDAGSDSLITDSVFMPVLLNTVKAGGYVVTVCKSAESAKKIYEHPDWEVLSNDSACQAIHFKDGSSQIAFFAAGSLKLPNHRFIRVNRPCLIMIKDQQLWISDPGHKGGRYQIQWNKQSWEANIPSDGTTIEATPVN